MVDVRGTSGLRTAGAVSAVVGVVVALVLTATGTWLPERSQDATPTTAAADAPTAPDPSRSPTVSTVDVPGGSTGTAEVDRPDTASTTDPPPVLEPRDWPDSMFPERRIVAMYGNDASAALGVLGEQGPDAAVARLAAIVAPFQEGDRPVHGAFELIATIATREPGPDGLYRAPSSPEHVRRYLDVATANGLLLILDIQPGRSDFVTELRRYEEFLRLPNVHAALDPEWRVARDEVPGQVVGRVSAAEVNMAADYLSGLVRDEGLPEKLLVVHQFQQQMIIGRDTLIEPPGVALTIHMDGFGAQHEKLGTYAAVAVEGPLHNGFKLFYDEDVDMFEAHEVLAIEPVPDLITYQ